jgi:hypothetical protein
MRLTRVPRLLRLRGGALWLSERGCVPAAVRRVQKPDAFVRELLERQLGPRALSKTFSFQRVSWSSLSASEPWTMPAPT